jgi:16S rRNA (cytidine1402-2'-O)-methyltransferase
MNKTIYLIGTPLGNLDDITVRALKTLENSEVIFAESIRSITTLLKYHNIRFDKEKIYLYDEKKVKFKDIKNILLQYKNISYVSDRGLPVFMDPGNKFLKFAEENFYQIKVLPGISALSVALVYAGINEPFYFAGFPPRENYLRIPFIKNLSKYDVILLYEAPFRNKKLLEELKKYLTDSWEVFLFLNLTMENEKILRFNLKDSSILLKEVEKLPAVFILKKILKKNSSSN